MGKGSDPGKYLIVWYLYNLEFMRDNFYMGDIYANWSSGKFLKFMSKITPNLWIRLNHLQALDYDKVKYLKVEVYSSYVIIVPIVWYKV